MLFPEIAKEWHPTKNGALTPYEITHGSTRKVWWKCDVADDHEWQVAPNTRTNNNTGCPYCANQKVTLSNCLATTHPEVAKQWHPTKNEQLTPNDGIETFMF